MERVPPGIVEYCLNNVDDETRAALLRAGPWVVESSCLQRCGLCYDGPFLLADGEEFDGMSHAELLRRALGAICGSRTADDGGARER